MKLRLLLAFAAFASSAPTVAQSFAQPIADSRLDTMRGGFDLPNGLSIGLGVTTETRIDGQLVLRTVFAANQGPPSLTTFGRDESGELVGIGAAEGSPVVGPDGTIRIVSSGNSSRIILNGQGVDISHLAGEGIGSIIANISDSRTIDVRTTVDVDIRNATPDLVGSSLLRVESLALDVTRSLVR